MFYLHTKLSFLALVSYLTHTLMHGTYIMLSIQNRTKSLSIVSECMYYGFLYNAEK